MVGNPNLMSNLVQHRFLGKKPGNNHFLGKSAVNGRFLGKTTKGNFNFLHSCLGPTFSRLYLPLVLAFVRNVTNSQTKICNFAIMMGLKQLHRLKSTTYIVDYALIFIQKKYSFLAVIYKILINSSEIISNVAVSEGHQLFNNHGYRLAAASLNKYLHSSVANGETMGE